MKTPKNQSSFLDLVDNPQEFRDSSIRDPHPILVSQEWNFPLSFIEAYNPDDNLYHAVQWTMGLGAKTRATWQDIKKQLYDAGIQLNIQIAPHVAADGKTYQVEYISQNGCYLVAQEMKVTKTRPQLKDIKVYLATVGAIVDSEDRNPNKGIARHTQRLVKNLKAQGKDELDIATRLEGIIHRKSFTQYLTEVINEVLTSRDFADATNLVYIGLWDRTALQLRKEMNLKKSQSLRDYQPRLAVMYESIAEEVCAAKLGERQELTKYEAYMIISHFVEIIGKQAAETSAMLGIDLATGKPLLEGGD